MNKRFSLSQIILNFVFIIISALIILPFLLVVSTSFSDEVDIAKYGYRFIPMNFTIEAYKYIFKNPGTIIDAYKVTIAFSTLGTFLSVLFTCMIAYPLSQTAFKARNKIAFYLYFTCLFSGGLVPSYLLITKYLHLADTFWVYIFPTCVSAFYVFMMRTFFQDIPDGIIEAAFIDGENDIGIFFKFILPLSKPAIATIALLTFLAKWNDWNTSLLYIEKQELISLQYLLQRLLNNLELLQNNETLSAAIKQQNIPSESVRMAMAVVVAGPALFIFPFFQKYFVKGMTVGSVKG